MKFPVFGYVRPASLADAVAALADDEDAVPMAGGQSLLTMLSFRIGRPGRIVDIARLPELTSIEVAADVVRIGAGVTHSQIEDGAIHGMVGAFLARAARGIAFRAIRNRGTIGGSLAHADPAADWPVILAGLDASIETTSPNGALIISVSELIEDPMQTVLSPGELISSIHVPLSGWRGFGLNKIARKSGEFAEALAVAVVGEKGLSIWIGALAGRPVQIVADADPDELTPDRRVSDTASYGAVAAAVRDAVPEAAPYRVHLSAVAACRAIHQAYAAETDAQ
jgi:aerobic carbon-monoxide dehydrogenase medium subunit